MSFIRQLGERAVYKNEIPLGQIRRELRGLGVGDLISAFSDVDGLKETYAIDVAVCEVNTPRPRVPLDLHQIKNFAGSPCLPRWVSGKIQDPADFYAGVVSKYEGPLRVIEMHTTAHAGILSRAAGGRRVDATGGTVVFDAWIRQYRLFVPDPGHPARLFETRLEPGTPDHYLR